MTYVWQCNDCGDRIEIQRKMAQSQEPPNADEHGHQSGFKRIITNPSMVLVHENEARYFE